MLWIINCYYAQTNPYDSYSRHPQPCWAKCNKQPKVEKSFSKADGSRFYTLTIVYLCLSLHNFSPVYPIAAIQTLKSSWCYGDLHVILCTRSHDYTKVYQDGGLRITKYASNNVTLVLITLYLFNFSACDLLAYLFEFSIDT